jgi:RsiW-degrading membrane proteinase PrsW (M82 family)/ribosomal protein S18 acetylase RimI-like enzyme
MTEARAQAPATSRPNRKWLGRKGGLLIVGFGAVLWFAIEVFDLTVEKADEAPTSGLIVGGFTVAVAFVYTMAYRLRPSDELGVVRLLLAFLVGGLLATILIGPFEYLVNLSSGGTPEFPSLLSLWLAGVFEEPAKILFVLIVARGLSRRNVRNGLFLGAAVGFGFAGYENMGYARAAWNTTQADHGNAFGVEVFTVVSRDVVGIFAHPLFTALLAAAVFAAVRNGRFRMTWRIVFVFIGVAFAHGLFDAAPVLVTRATGSSGAGLSAQVTVVVLEAVVLSLIWRRVSKRANAAAAIGVRPATQEDLDFLTAALHEAANWSGAIPPGSYDVRKDPGSWRYLEGWQRATDFGVILTDGEQPAGAAWARFFPSSARSYGYVDDGTPEITLAVVPPRRRSGFGTQLLEALAGAARDRGIPALSLSVEDGNDPARNLYAKLGFVVVGRTGNSDTMRLALSVDAAPPVASSPVA